MEGIYQTDLAGELESLNHSHSHSSVLLPSIHKKTKKSRKLPDEEIPLDSSRNKFNEILQQASTMYLESTQNDVKASKKKKKKKIDQDVLESLKKGEGLVKDVDDATLLANTYDPDSAMTNTKNNKNRAKSKKNTSGNENLAFDLNEDDTLKKKGKSRKLPKMEESVVIDKEMSMSELDPPTTKKKAKPKEEPLTSAKKKTKKKTQRTPTPNDELVTSDAADTDGRGLTSDDAIDTDTVDRKKKKKKKRKAKREEPIQAAVTADSETMEAAAADEEEHIPRVIADQGKIAGITVHRTDKLKTDFFMAHPVVRISMIDANTGQYITKQTKGRAVTSYYEQQDLEKVIPIITQPYDFKVHKSTLPMWEEIVIFNENFDYLVQTEPQVIVFFEVMDFVSMSAASEKYNNAKQEGGWHRIAWAFLKVLGANGKPNTDRKVRLQLYYPMSHIRGRGKQLEIFQWWKSKQRIPYPSSIYVTVKGIVPPIEVEPAARSMFATQEERGRLTYDELQRTLDGGVSKASDRDPSAKKGLSLWNRFPGQVCKVPNAPFQALPSGRKGCFVVKFSHDGRLLACGCADNEGHPILIYEIPSGKLKCQLLGHYCLIYDLCWSNTDKHLVSSSADGTSRIWDVVKFSSSAWKTLPHPSYVYCGKFHPRVSKIVVTSSYDRIIRIWSTEGNDELHGSLLQELNNHKSYVNALCFDEEGTMLYSGDSVGQINVWNAFVTNKPSSRGVQNNWSLKQEICDAELMGTAINNIALHPNGRRLLVHCRDGKLRLFDLRMGSVTQRYLGALNWRDQIRSVITPCGTFVFAGSEDNNVFVWNTESGDKVAVYSELNFRSPICGIDFHPHDNIIAFSSYGEDQVILLYKFDLKVAQREVGFDTVQSLTLKNTGRPMSPEMLAAYADKSDDEGLDTMSLKMRTQQDMQLQESARWERVRQKLESVTSKEPAMFSPHASSSMTQSMRQRQFADEMEYMKQGTQGWRPGFSAVGARNSGGRGQMSMNVSTGKPQFSYLRNPLKGISGNTELFSAVDASLVKPAAPVRHNSLRRDMMRMQEVVALYDYQAQRSDEISLVRGDVITVLFKDNDNWWMGELPSGNQGFFPANYVASTNNDETSPEPGDTRIQMDDDDDEVRESVTAAVVSKSGELKFISGAEDSDADIPSQRPKKKNRKSRETVINIEDSDEGGAPVKATRKKRTAKRESMA
ncbi:hypothetical protein CAPTEDRAFT_228034 [Capitella teleta]|uniref:SH3 domain-containing protein n=1 Tax=Capitella teleta TaxID=283909 RepID=R7TGL7_CAPTE|nr:hypothetical protein CAPTEDRAFT_228034 [Capitella teleta]|eukprot:ELT92642.1 hypothetical protein CAPTEDRAFT_228034 [Capitella teleta]